MSFFKQILRWVDFFFEKWTKGGDFFLVIHLLYIHPCQEQKLMKDYCLADVRMKDVPKQQWPWSEGNFTEMCPGVESAEYDFHLSLLCVTEDAYGAMKDNALWLNPPCSYRSLPSGVVVDDIALVRGGGMEEEKCIWQSRQVNQMYFTKQTSKPNVFYKAD